MDERASGQAGDKPLRVLLLEDSMTDAELVERELRKASLTCSLTRVETKDAFLNALEELKPDLVKWLKFHSHRP